MPLHRTTRSAGPFALAVRAPGSVRLGFRPGIQLFTRSGGYRRCSDVTTELPARRVPERPGPVRPGERAAAVRDRCDRCDAELREVLVQPYVPGYDPHGNDAYLAA